MKNGQIIGIDVSKSVLDVFIHFLNFHFTIENNPTGFAKLLEICCTRLSCKSDGLSLCFENTGRYSRPLAVFCEQNDITFAMVNALDALAGVNRINKMLKQLPFMLSEKLMS